MPGFTQISMYPKLFEASGISYKELLNKTYRTSLIGRRWSYVFNV